MRPFVYGLVDPAEPTHVRYVGMASQDANRPYHHSKVARQDKSQRFYVYRWIRKIQMEGREPEAMILEQLPENTSLQLLGFVEQCYIESLREIGHRLTNTAKGGQGGQTISGEAMSAIIKKVWDTRSDLRKEASERAFKLARTEGNNFGKGQPWDGKRHSDESKQRMSLTHTLQQNTPEWRAHQSAAIRACDAASPERRRKLSEAAKRQVRLPHSEETRRKMSESWTDERRASNPLIGRPRPLDVRERISAARKGWKPSEETLANMRAAAQKREAMKRLARDSQKGE